MGLQPKINGKTVERAYEDYRNGSYLVNRRYQRKLVWNISEKEAFIDSLKNGYPVPLFLFSVNEYKDQRRQDAYYTNMDEKDGRGYKTEKAVQVRGTEVISNQFLYIIDEIKKIFFEQDHTIIQHILDQRVYKGPRYFQSLFLALHELLIKKEMKIADYNQVYEKLHNIAERTMIISKGGGAWSAKDKYRSSCKKSCYF